MDEIRIAVDQVGYPLDAEKRAVVVGGSGSFAVVDPATDTIAFEAELSDPIADDDSGDRVRVADFSGLDRPGEYVVEVHGETSSAFEVAEDVYEGALRTVCRSYALRRSVTAIDDPETGLSIEAGHEGDAEAELYFADPLHEAEEPLDVSGGWYDAGDYGKYVPPAAITVGQLLSAYESNPDAFYPGQFDYPPGYPGAGDDLPDLLAETRFELEWLERMQRPDGAVYHKVASLEWPAMDTRPAEDTQQRYVFGLSTYGTAMYAGAMAMAARVYRDHDPGFADRALANAESAFEYLESNPDPDFRFDEGQDDGSGPYRKDEDDEERFWAAAELLRTTGENRYDEYLDRFDALFEEPPRPVTWSDALALGQWAYYRAEEGDPDRRDRIERSTIARADELVAEVEADGYRNALDPDEYVWASAKLAVAKGNLLLRANEMRPGEEYVEAALDQVHYVLGRTPTGYSYVTGLGSNPPRNVHDRLQVSTGTYIPGLLVGGPNRYGGDPVLDEYLDSESPPPAKAYLDDVESFSSNEFAIDYMAPLVYALASLSA